MITVLRIGHRIKRDERISTHAGLVARAFGADEIIYSGEKDAKMISGIRKVVKRWGGPFSVKYASDYRKTIREKSKRSFTAVHMTMYGIPFEKKLRTIRNKRNLLIIVGGEKVPAEVYRMADFNVSVTSQPHSEVAALAVFLAALKLRRTFKNAKLRIVPQERGKKVISSK